MGTPSKGGVKVQRKAPGDVLCVKERYSELVGCLMYLAGCPRPDAVPQAEVLVWYMSASRQWHWHTGRGCRGTCEGRHRMESGIAETATGTRAISCRLREKRDPVARDDTAKKWARLLGHARFATQSAGTLSSVASLHQATASTRTAVQSRSTRVSYYLRLQPALEARQPRPKTCRRQRRARRRCAASQAPPGPRTGVELTCAHRESTARACWSCIRIWGCMHAASRLVSIVVHHVVQEHLHRERLQLSTAVRTAATSQAFDPGIQPHPDGCSSTASCSRVQIMYMPLIRVSFSATHHQIRLNQGRRLKVPRYIEACLSSLYNKQVPASTGCHS